MKLRESFQSVTHTLCGTQWAQRCSQGMSRNRIRACLSQCTILLFIFTLLLKVCSPIPKAAFTQGLSQRNEATRVLPLTSICRLFFPPFWKKLSQYQKIINKMKEIKEKQNEISRKKERHRHLSNSVKYARDKMKQNLSLHFFLSRNVTVVLVFPISFIATHEKLDCKSVCSMLLMVKVASPQYSWCCPSKLTVRERGGTGCC